jgi:hypothetical protein
MSGFSSRGRIMFGATLAGLGGVLSGWAMFLLVVEESDRMWQLVATLMVASVFALALEYFRETIREGHSEMEKFSFIPAGIGIVTLIVVCELIVKANEHVAEVFGSLPAVHAALIGSDPSDSRLNPWWILVGLVGIWVYMGIAAARWLIAMVESDRQATSKSPWARIGWGAGVGAVASLLCAFFSLLGVLAFRLFVILADAGEFRAALGQIGEWHRLPPWVMPFPWLMKFWHFLLGALGDWKLDQWWGTGWRAFPAAVLVLALTSVPFLIAANVRDRGWASVRPKGWGWVSLALFLWILVAPLVLQRPWTVAVFPLRAIAIWLIPCLILGAMIPLLKSVSERIGWWLGTALVVSAILFLAVSVWQSQPGGIVLGSIFLVLSFLSFTQQNWSPTFQSLLPVIVAMVMLGPHGLWVQASHVFVGDWQLLATVQPAAVPKRSDRWFYPEPLSAFIGPGKTREAIEADL